MYGKFPKPSVSAVIFNQQKKLLLTLRSETVLCPRTWCLPGGHLDGGQSWESAAAREVKEEVGLTVKKLELIGIYSDPLGNTIIDEKTGELLHFLNACFLVEEFEGRVQINHEVIEYGWFAESELPTPLLQGEGPKIKDAFSFQGKAFLR